MLTEQRRKHLGTCSLLMHRPPFLDTGVKRFFSRGLKINSGGMGKGRERLIDLTVLHETQPGGEGAWTGHVRTCTRYPRAAQAPDS